MKMHKKSSGKIPAKVQIALESMKEAVSGVVEEHKRLKMPMHVWKDGKSVAFKPWVTKNKD